MLMFTRLFHISKWQHYRRLGKIRRWMHCFCSTKFGSSRKQRPWLMPTKADIVELYLLGPRKTSVKGGGVSPILPDLGKTNKPNSIWHPPFKGYRVRGLRLSSLTLCSQITIDMVFRNCTLNRVWGIVVNKKRSKTKKLTVRHHGEGSRPGSKASRGEIPQ